jgi:hypothetical protein
VVRKATTVSKDMARIFWTALAAIGVLIVVALAALGVWQLRELILDREGPTIVDRGTVLGAIERVNKQVFIQHNLAVDIEYTQAPEGWFEWLQDLGIKQQFVVLLWGRVPAGFDLRQLDQEDIWISPDGKRIRLTLPPPVIFEDSVSIDFDRSRVYSLDTCPDLLCRDSVKDYQELVMPEAADRLVQAAREYGILEQAARDGQAYYEQFLKSMGFEEVQVIVTGYMP